jgi:hypothetical protein
MESKSGHHSVRTGLFETKNPATTRKAPIKPSNHKTKTGVRPIDALPLSAAIRRIGRVVMNGRAGTVAGDKPDPSGENVGT